MHSTYLDSSHGIAYTNASHIVVGVIGMQCVCQALIYEHSPYDMVSQICFALTMRRSIIKPRRQRRECQGFVRKSGANSPSSFSEDHSVFPWWTTL